MADAPPPGPPPPKVPEGWKAVWNDQYKEWSVLHDGLASEPPL